MTMIDKNLEIFNKTIQKAKSIAVCSHVSPDGDAVGSSTALFLALKEMGKEVYLVKNDDIPTNLSFLQNDDYYTDQPLQTDLFIVTDVASLDRIGSGAQFYQLAKDSLCIDHHMTNKGFFNNNIVEAHLSSTCELIASLLLSGGYTITKEIASYLYLGITTDTNRFLYESTSAKTLQIASLLLEKGADKMLINLELYENMNPDYLLLQAEVIKNSIRFNEDSFILASLRLDQLERFNLDHDKVESLVSILKSITGIELACLVKEYEENVQKISFRSKSTIDVSKLATEFGGGGHVRASGATINATNQEAYKLLKERLEKISWKVFF